MTDELTQEVIAQVEFDINAQETEVKEMAFILEEGEDDKITRTIFFGGHDELNLYQIWYNKENEVTLRVIDSFVPIVRVKHKEQSIPKERLELGAVYKVAGRNFNQAVWDGDMFWGVRYKFGSHFMDGEHHYDDGSPHGTCIPLRRLT